MAESKIVTVDGNPMLWVNGKAVPACAYITYFDENNRYADFKSAGYRLFSVTVALSSRPINSATGFSPYLKGVYDKENEPDFSCVDEAVGKIISVCPDAYIFPRVYITMPEWWCEKNSGETIDTPDGNVRELLFSDKFRSDGAEMLKGLIEHIKHSNYSDNIIGYHLAGGCTEEWFHFGRRGGRCDNAEKYFISFLNENYPDEPTKRKLPDINGIVGEGEIEDLSLRRYLEFSNTAVADTITVFAKTVKEAVNFSKTVGVFYGYTMDICSGLLGDLAIEQLLDSEYIDFFCSPNSYCDVRALGKDWGDMIASDSVKSHGKMCLLECDIRTSLSDYINNCRPGADKNNSYYGAVWKGPETVKESVYAIRKSYAHQLTRRNGMWWFDMWGGWYACGEYMREMERCLSLFGASLGQKCDINPEIAIFADGRLYQRQHVGSPYYMAQYEVRNSFGNSGVLYKNFLLSDFKRQYKNFKGVVFPIPVSSDELREAVDICEKNNIPYLLSTPEKWNFTPEEIRDFAKKAGAWVYCDSNDVIYAGNGIIAIHTASAGCKTVNLPGSYLICDACSDSKPFKSDKIVLNAEKYQTSIFTVQGRL